ncbi:hypothetical protein HYP07_gp091 [Vibrio phage JSF3]|uniref:hypothetical protein n=1 Tax=Vibrio phage JSF3 TaxID=1916111 RepID=UPI000B5F69B5|nr:hypothetical protein HYP07_gp091 [Vibrio phage JSF3]APD18103.1 hypothetical protein [Vibrio phage JSF3]
MKLLNVYYNKDSSRDYPLLEIPNGIKLISVPCYTYTAIQEYTFARPQQAKQWCGDKLTRKDNEIISNLQK